MRTGSRTLALIAVTALVAGCGRSDRIGASSPKRLVDKLVLAIEELDARGVSACFDPRKPEGAAVAELCGKAIGVLKKSRELETAIRSKFGADYVDEHVALPGPALLFQRFREQLRAASFSDVEGNVVRLEVDGAKAASMYSSGRLWFLEAPAPFAGDATLGTQVNQILDILGGHIDKATKLVESSGPEKEFRTSMATLGKQTKAACAPILTAVMISMRQKDLLPEK